MISLIKVAIILIICSLHAYHVHSAQVLAIFPFPSQSHAILGSHLLKGLAKRGHHVTMLSSYPLKQPFENYTDLVMNSKKLTAVTKNLINVNEDWTKTIHIYNIFAKLSETFFEDKTVLKLINSNKKFDIIIYSHLTQYSLFGFSHKFNASTVIFSVIGPSQFLAYTTNIPQTSSHVPHIYLPYGEKMNFWERALNLLVNTVGYLQLALVNEPQERRLLKKYFSNAPSLDVLVNNIQLVFINSHIALEPIKPIFQNMINIGGFYMDEKVPLSDPVQQFLDRSKKGVIYMNFGSNIKSEHLTPKSIETFLNSFKQLPYDILWKLDIDLAQKSPNVMIVKWVQQISVLSHDNVKVFIGHAGRGSINEAIYYGKPMMLFPLFVDQQMNAKNAVDDDIALALDLYDFTLNDFDMTLKQLLYNDTFKRNIMQKSVLLQNQSVHPMEHINYWIKYLAKYGNVRFLKSEAISMPWYKLMMFDIFAVISVFVIFAILLLNFLIRKMYSYCYCCINYKGKVKIN